MTTRISSPISLGDCQRVADLLCLIINRCTDPDADPAALAKSNARLARQAHSLLAGQEFSRNDGGGITRFVPTCEEASP